MRDAVAAVLVLTMCLTFVTASKDDVHMMPDGSLMLDENMAEVGSVPEKIHVMPDGSIMADSEMGVDSAFVDLQEDAALETEDDTEDIDLMLSGRDKFGPLKKAFDTGKKLVETAKKKGLKAAAQEALKHIMPDKTNVGPAPPSAPVKKTWISWTKVIEAMRLGRESYKSPDKAAAFFKKCGVSAYVPAQIDIQTTGDGICQQENKAFANRSALTSAGWSLTGFDEVDTLRDQQKCGSEHFHARKTGNGVGVASKTLRGSGKAELEYGNCWDAGKVNVYLNGKMISSASPLTRSKRVKFKFGAGDKLEVKDEEGNAVVQLIRLKLECDRGFQNLKNFSAFTGEAQCDFFKNRTASMQLRKVWHKGSFEKHTGVECLVTSTTVQAADQLSELEVEIPTRLVEQAEQHASAARQAALKAAEFARLARDAASFSTASNRPRDAPKATTAMPTGVPATQVPTGMPTGKPTQPPTKAPKEDPDAGEIWVVFRGSNEQKDTIADLKGILVPWPYGDKVGNVHQGFFEQYKQVREQIKAEVLRLISMGHTKLHITGHSLGGALSELCAMDVAHYTKGTKLKFFAMTSFGAPDPADQTWVANYDRKVKLSTRVVYESDIVPCVPGGYKPVAALSHIVNKIVGAPDAKKYKQVRTLLHFFRGKWRSIQWPKCDMYKQSIDDHSGSKYLNALLKFPIND